MRRGTPGKTRNDTASTGDSVDGERRRERPDQGRIVYALIVLTVVVELFNVPLYGTMPPTKERPGSSMSGST